jgi:hypothetical protein
LGLGQWAWAGEFRVLPWQGAYNFYAANRADANGRYYVQHMTFNDIAPGDNPARRESEAAYARATGATPPFAVDAMEAYWREQARAAIAANPIGWLKLMFLKTYYLFNDYDQYNNQTYAWHQARSPWLRWNFLGWGVLLVLAAGALGLALVRPLAVPAPAAGILLVFAAYGAGVLLYYASGRFRLPLAPLLCVLAGGWVEGLAHWLSPASPSSRRAAWVAGLAMLAAATLTFSTFFHACDDSTFLEDEMQVSSAASAIGDDALAYAMAQSAVARDPTRPDVRRLDMMCYFNLALTGPPAATTAAGWREQLTHLDGLDLLDPGQALVAGVACWKTGDQMRALQIWRDSAARAGPHSPPAQILAAAQVALGQAPPGVPPPDPDLLKILRGS